MLVYFAQTIVSWAATITVFAAASLTDALNQIGAQYHQLSGDEVVFSFAGSSLLARQIEHGAPADVFFSAEDRQMDGLEKKGFIIDGSRRSRLSNALVIVVPKDSSLRLSSAEGLAQSAVQRLALADPAAVPAGVYARQYLEGKHLWNQVKQKVVPAANVRAALAAVASGNVDAGIVYKTDAAISRNVKIAFEIPAAEGPKIDYPVALVKDTAQRAAARKFLEYLESADAGRIFTRYGFIVQNPQP